MQRRNRFVSSMVHVWSTAVSGCVAGAVWMQTTGTSLLAVNWFSSARVRTLAQDSRSADGLLYLLLYRMTGENKNAVKIVLTSPPLSLPLSTRTDSDYAQSWLRPSAP
jgi:hypothetical protein